MTRERHARNALRRIALTTAAVLVMVVLITGVDTVAARLDPDGPPAPRFEPLPEPIPEEAGVFRTHVGELASGDAERRSDVHPRTLATFRMLRAWPGAPPRVPHGLTAEEFRASSCNTCHERGGFVARFASYAPVTPHPELSACLQCHATDATLVGIDYPDQGRDAVCRQCHDPANPSGDRIPSPPPELWPVPSSVRDGMPQLIPHDLAMRANCLACHAGPSAVAEIRTTHPERSDCRQCHLPLAADADVFQRPPAPLFHLPGAEQ
ncbi:MAG TPA: hypothetical protein VK912_10140 [Longimicrobiales bacterium]|nr:hypothetical protein [Longimicrobiales bacterium]